MEGDEPVMAQVYKNRLSTFIEQALETADLFVTIPETVYPAWIADLGAGDFYFAVLVDATGIQEIIKVKFDGSSAPDTLAIERGQEGSTAKAWARGSYLYQDITSGMLENLQQKEGYRQAAFNPNATLTADYFGEKFYQSDLRLWWKSVGLTSEWRLIAGEIFTADPIFSPVAGSYPDGTLITITSATPGAAIYYTTDGTDPDETDTLYTVPFALPDGVTTTLKAKAFGVNRWEQPSGITSGAYTMVAAGGTMWVDKSMPVGNANHLRHSSSGNTLLRADTTSLYERVGFSWVLRVSDIPGSGANSGNDLLVDGNNVWFQGNRALKDTIVFTDTLTFPAWTLQVDSQNIPFGGDYNFQRLIVFGGTVYFTVFSSNTANIKHGLYRVNGVDNVSFYSKFDASDTNILTVNRPLEFSGAMYAIVRSGATAYLNNLLRLDFPTAVRVVTDNLDPAEPARGLFIYGGKLHAWGSTTGPDRCQIVRWDGGTSWTIVKEVSAPKGEPDWGDHTQQIGNKFYHYQQFRGHMWEWDPVGDTLQLVADNLTVVSTANDSGFAYDQSDSPPSIYLALPGGSNKTYRWE